MKRLICTVCVALMLICALPLSVEAHAATSGTLTDTLQWKLENGTCQTVDLSAGVWKYSLCTCNKLK